MINNANPASAERTRLSWRRTVLAATIVVVLAARLAVHDGPSPAAAVALACAVLAWIALLRLTHHRIQAMAYPEPRAIGRTLPAVALLVVCFALLGLVLVAISYPG